MNIALGRYIPGNSLIHKLDPRIKILCMLILLITVFIDVGFIGYGVLLVFILLCLLLSNLSLRYIYKSIKPMFVMAGILLIINVLINKTGNVLLSLGSFEIYDEAIFQTLYIFIRLVLMITITTIITSTTKPLDLTLGIEDLLAPFTKIKVPAHEIAMMISIALRFIPTLIEETERIIKAQSSRGVDFENGKLTEKLKAIISLIVPLFVSSFQRAEDLANAMEARGYIPDGKRTRYKQLHVHFKDIVCLIITIIILVAFIVYRVVVL